MIEPLGFRVLIKADVVEEKTESGIILMSSTVEEERLAQMYGTVVAIGPTAWFAYDKKDNPDWKPWCEVGDRVSYAKFGGKFIKDPVTKEEYVIVNDVDITARVS